jgi:hypothetical protein
VVGRSVVGAIGCFEVVTCEVGVLVQLLCDVWESECDKGGDSSRPRALRLLSMTSISS